MHSILFHPHILPQVFDFLTSSDIHSNLIICRAWNELLQPMLFKKVKITKSEKLKLWLSGKMSTSGMWERVRGWEVNQTTLPVLPLIPSKMPSLSSLTLAFVFSPAPTVSNRAVSNSNHLAQCKLNCFMLKLALPELSTLKSLVWIESGDGVDLENELNDVFSGLSELKNLREIELQGVTVGEKGWRNWLFPKEGDFFKVIPSGSNSEEESSEVFFRRTIDSFSLSSSPAYTFYSLSIVDCKNLTWLDIFWIGICCSELRELTLGRVDLDVGESQDIAHLEMTEDVEKERMLRKKREAKRGWEMWKKIRGKGVLSEKIKDPNFLPHPLSMIAISNPKLAALALLDLNFPHSTPESTIFSHFSSLSLYSLTLARCPTLTEDTLLHFPEVKYLRISSCESIGGIPIHGFVEKKGMRNLEKVSIMNSRGSKGASKMALTVGNLWEIGMVCGGKYDAGKAGVKKLLVDLVEGGERSNSIAVWRTFQARRRNSSLNEPRSQRRNATQTVPATLPRTDPSYYLQFSTPPSSPLPSYLQPYHHLSILSPRLPNEVLLEVLSEFVHLESLGLFGWIKGGEFMPIQNTVEDQISNGASVEADAPFPGSWRWDEQREEEAKRRASNPILSGTDKPMDYQWNDESFAEDLEAEEDLDNTLLSGSGRLVNFLRWLLYAELSYHRKKAKNFNQLRKRLTEAEIDYLRGRGKCQELINISV